jgi:hypothetical protein
MPTLQALTNTLEQMAKTRDRDLAKFQEKLKTDAVHAFEWADSVMASTAAGHIADHYLETLFKWRADFDAGTLGDKQPQTEEAAVEWIRASVTRQALQKGRYPKQSTSMCSNKMDQLQSACYAELACDWEMIF